MRVISASLASAIGFLGIGPGPRTFIADIPERGTSPLPGRKVKRRAAIKSRVKLLALVSVCANGSHGWFRAAGISHPIRKPFDGETINWTPEVL